MRDITSLNKFSPRQLCNYCLPIMFSIARTDRMRENAADCTTSAMSAPAIGSDAGRDVRASDTRPAAIYYGALSRRREL